MNLINKWFMMMAAGRKTSRDDMALRTQWDQHPGHRPEVHHYHERALPNKGHREDLGRAGTESDRETWGRCFLGSGDTHVGDDLD